MPRFRTESGPRAGHRIGRAARFDQPDSGNSVRRNPPFSALHRPIAQGKTGARPRLGRAGGRDGRTLPLLRGVFDETSHFSRTGAQSARHRAPVAVQRGGQHQRQHRPGRPRIRARPHQPAARKPAARPQRRAAGPPLPRHARHLQRRPQPTGPRHRQTGRRPGTQRRLCGPPGPQPRNARRIRVPAPDRRRRGGHVHRARSASGPPRRPTGFRGLRGVKQMPSRRRDPQNHRRGRDPSRGGRRAEVDEDIVGVAAEIGVRGE